VTDGQTDGTYYYIPLFSSKRQGTKKLNEKIVTRKKYKENIIFFEIVKSLEDTKSLNYNGIVVYLIYIGGVNNCGCALIEMHNLL
jgi:hypothetical protein